VNQTVDSTWPEDQLVSAEEVAEGDAGEVYLVESLLDHNEAILKRPKPSVFSGMCGGRPIRSRPKDAF